MNEVMDPIPQSGTVLRPAETGPRARPYEAPVLVEWGSIRELTAGIQFDTQDDDFSGSGGG